MKISSLMKWILIFLLVAGTFSITRADDTALPTSNGDASQAGVGVNAPAPASAPAPVEPVESQLYSEGSQRLSLDIGAGIPTSANDFSNSERIGPMGGLQYLYSLNEYWGVGVQADYFHFSAKDHSILSNAGGQVNVRSWDNVATLEVIGRYNLMPNVKFVPYLDSGLGLTYFHQIANGEPLPGSTWADTGSNETRDLQDVATVNFAYSIGIGVETSLTNNLVLGLESAWQIFGVSQSTYGTATIEVPTVSLRLGWRFGPKTPAAS